MKKAKRETFNLVKCITDECFPENISCAFPVVLKDDDDGDTWTSQLYISNKDVQSADEMTIAVLEKVIFTSKGYTCTTGDPKMMLALDSAYDKMEGKDYHQRWLKLMTQANGNHDEMFINIFMILIHEQTKWTPPMSWFIMDGSSIEANLLLVELVQAKRIMMGWEMGTWPTIVEIINPTIDKSHVLSERELSFVSLYSAVQQHNHGYIINVKDEEARDACPLLLALHCRVVWQYKGKHSHSIPTHYIVKIMKACILTGTYLFLDASRAFHFMLRSAVSIPRTVQTAWNKVAFNELIHDVCLCTNTAQVIGRMILSYCRESSYGFMTHRFGCTSM